MPAPQSLQSQGRHQIRPLAHEVCPDCHSRGAPEKGRGGAKTVDSLGEPEAVGSLGGAVSPQTPASLLLGPLGPPPWSYPHAASCSLPRGTSAVDPDLHSLKTCLPYFCAF